MTHHDDKTLVILPDWLISIPGERPFYRFGIRVKGCWISDVDTHTELINRYPNDEILHAPRQVLSPGFVNTHTHLYGVLAHGIPIDKAPSGFWPFLEDFWWPLVENRLDHGMISAATRLRCAQMLKSGVTSFYDCTEAPYALPGCLVAQAEIVNQFGLRAILSFEATERVSVDNGRLGLEENLGFSQACNERKQQDPGWLISGMMCFHTTFTCSAKMIQKAFELAEQQKVLLHAHVSEGTYEPEHTLAKFGMRPMQYYQQLGIANPRFIASQCVQIDPAEIEIIKNQGVKVSHMPLSNCEVGGGIAPVPELINAGVTVGLGSDGYIEDFFEIMRGAFLIHKANLRNPTIMPAALVWRLATEEGASALGLEKVGRVEKGWLADFQLIDLDLPTPVEEHNLYEQVLLYRNAWHVKTVFVNGIMKVHHGQVIGVDWEHLQKESQIAAKRLWN